MADPAKKAPAPVVRLAGRVESIRRVSGTNGVSFVHLVKLPAADEFSSPATVRVNAEQRCGEVGQPFDQLCQVGGYGRSYQTTDEETGHKRTERTADNTLTVVG